MFKILRDIEILHEGKYTPIAVERCGRYASYNEKTDTHYQNYKIAHSRVPKWIKKILKIARLI